MSVNQDTDRTKAIVIKNISHTWLYKLDRLIGKAKAENGCNVDVFAPFRGKDKPIETRVTTIYKDYSSE